MTIYDILKDSDYKAEQFSNEAIDKLNARITEKTDKNGKAFATVNCLVRKRRLSSIRKRLYGNSLSTS